LQVHWQVIRSKRDIDVTLQITMCACILHNLLIDHAIPQDLLADNNLDIDEEEESDNLSAQIKVIIKDGPIF